MSDYSQLPDGGQHSPIFEPDPPQSKVAMILISFFVGTFGVHRYLMGYKNWWVMLITFGGCGIWSLVDFIRIITGDMRMADGRPLKE